MKKIYFLLLSILLSSASFAQILAEDFDYGTTAGDLTTMSGGAWVLHSGSADPVAYVAAPTSLTMTGYPSSGIGGHATFSGASQDINRAFPEISTGTVYASALINLSAVGSGNYFIHFNSGGFRARVGAKDDGNGDILFGIGTSSSTLTYGTTPYSLNTTYLLVFSYEIATGVSNLHVLSAAAVTEPAAPEATNTGNTGTAINAIAFRQSSNIPSVAIDGVRVAENWNDIMNNSTTPSLSITAPVNGTEYAPGTTSVDVTTTVQNFMVANGTGDGHIHQILTTPGGTFDEFKYDTADQAIMVADGESYTIFMELVDNSNTPITPAVNVTVNFSVGSLTTVADIAALRADVDLNGTGGTYLLQSVPVVTYTRTSRNQKYIQDASAGVLIDDVPGNIATTFAEADGMSGLTGGVSIFNGVLQFNPSADATLVASTAVTPEVVTIATLLTDYADYQSELVKIVGATFTETGSFVNATDYTINDGASMVFRTNFSEADYIGQAIPTASGDIVVLVGEFSGAPQVTARTLTDLTLSTTSFEAKANFAVYPNPTNTGFVNITTTANEAIKVTVFNILGKTVLSQTVNNTVLNVSSLNAGVYILKLNQNGATTTKKLVIK